MGALAAAGFVAGWLGAAAPLGWATTGRSATSPNSQPIDGPPLPEELSLPQPELSPGQVVAEQMDALSRCRHDRSAIHQVRAFASSANRAATGTDAEFEKMVLSPPYDTMVVNRSWHAGRAAQHGDLATVLVTVVGPNNEVALFRFYLSRDAGEANGSWLTDHVYCLTGGAPPAPATESSQI